MATGKAFRIDGIERRNQPDGAVVIERWIAAPKISGQSGSDLLLETVHFAAIKPSLENLQEFRADVGSPCKTRLLGGGNRDGCALPIAKLFCRYAIIG